MCASSYDGNQNSVVCTVWPTFIASTAWLAHGYERRGCAVVHEFVVFEERPRRLETVVGTPAVLRYDAQRTLNNHATLAAVDQTRCYGGTPNRRWAFLVVMLRRRCHHSFFAGNFSVH